MPSSSILSFILTEVQLFNNYYQIKEREWIKERIEDKGQSSFTSSPRDPFPLSHRLRRIKTSRKTFFLQEVAETNACHQATCLQTGYHLYETTPASFHHSPSAPL